MCIRDRSNIGAAPQHPLAGSRLLPGRPVTRLQRKNQGAQACILCRFLRSLPNDIIDAFQGRKIAGAPRCLQRLGSLGPAHIARILPGERELGKLQRIAAV